MTKRLTALGLSTALFLSALCLARLPAAEPDPAQAAPRGDTVRLTPLVRAVKRAKSAVVNIHSEKTAFDGNGLFSSGKGRKINGMGTGVVIDERGYVVTNHHVVKDVDNLRAVLHDGSTFAAVPVNTDPENDLAIIKIEPGKPLEVMPLGTSSDLMLGETVVAVGNAFGYEHTVTAGIISALHRDVEVNEHQSYRNLIQTDASINPGNSGGPLLNLAGEVVGINVAIRAGAQRIGFAIPIDDARKIIADLLNCEELSGAYHGLMAQDVKSGKTRQLIVASARAQSPAEKAGFQSGDVIVQAGTVKVNDRADFERALLEHPPGDKITVLVQRDDESQTLTLELAEQRKTAVTRAAAQAVFRGNNETATGAENTKGNEEKIWRALGVKLVKLPDGDTRLQSTKYHGGMQVTEVKSGGPADRNGIRTGDILVGLHLWETISHDNVSFVLNHPQLTSFNPLKFYIFRNGNTWYGNLTLNTASLR